MTTPAALPPESRKQLTQGVVLVGVGGILLAGQLPLDLAWDFGRIWPLVFVVLGVGRLISAPVDGGWGSAVWFLFLGGIFLMHTFRVLSIQRSWPLFIVAGGVAMIVGGLSARLCRPAAGRGRTGTSEAGRAAGDGPS